MDDWRDWVFAILYIGFGMLIAATLLDGMLNG